DFHVTGVQTCALPISSLEPSPPAWMSVTVISARTRSVPSGKESVTPKERSIVEALKPSAKAWSRAGEGLEAAGCVMLELLSPSKIGRASCRERVEMEV